jgi:hypothetical protein
MELAEQLCDHALSRTVIGGRTVQGPATGGIGSMFRVVTLPSEDAEFSADVRAALARADENAQSSRALLIALLEELLPRYPEMEISEQNGLASYQEDPNTLYVYRNGGQARTHAKADGLEIE